MNAEQLLEYIQRTNPEMTMEKLIKELGKNRYSSIALVMVSQNSKEKQEI